MKSNFSILLAIIARVTCSAALVSLEFSGESNPTILRQRDANVQETLGSKRVYYTVNVTLGTPPQNTTLLVDTGSSITWAPSKGDVAYDPKRSSSYKLTKADFFNVRYLDGSRAAGDFFKEDLAFGNDSIKAFEMGIAKEGQIVNDYGILGLGYSKSPDSGFVESMVRQGRINISAFSLFLDNLESSTGRIIFGGLDTDKCTGSLCQMPAMGGKLSVTMSSFGISESLNNHSTSYLLTATSFKESALLDSGTTLTYVPNALYESIFTTLNGYRTRDNKYHLVDCRFVHRGLTFDFGFGDGALIIKVPANEMIVSHGIYGSKPDDLNIPFKEACHLIIKSSKEVKGNTILGDTFYPVGLYRF